MVNEIDYLVIIFLSFAKFFQVIAVTSKAFWKQVMAGSGHLQTFRLLRFLRNRSSVDGHANYGIQMAVRFLHMP